MALSYGQYDIILVNLDPTVGSEIKKTRPCVIISPEEMNRHLNTIIIAPLTSTPRNYPTRFQISPASGNSSGWIALDQRRTIDKKRALKTLGKLSPEDIMQLKKIILEMLVE